jgi:excisionase family DNA binding protein
VSDELTTGEAAALMGVSVKTILRLLAAGQIEGSLPFGKRGGYRVSRLVLERWYRNRKSTTNNRRVTA